MYTSWSYLETMNISILFLFLLYVAEWKKFLKLNVPPRSLLTRFNKFRLNLDVIPALSLYAACNLSISFSRSKLIKRLSCVSVRILRLMDLRKDFVASGSKFPMLDPRKNITFFLGI